MGKGVNKSKQTSRGNGRGTCPACSVEPANVAVWRFVTARGTGAGTSPVGGRARRSLTSASAEFIRVHSRMRASGEGGGKKLAERELAAMLAL